jgi:hypothetical protein
VAGGADGGFAVGEEGEQAEGEEEDGDEDDPELDAAAWGGGTAFWTGDDGGHDDFSIRQRLRFAFQCNGVPSHSSQRAR